ncbi:DEAD/DEAH box helicase [Amedibacillus sp. YH-ame10]
MKFKEFSLDQHICDALEVLGYKEALPVQEAVIPEILAGHDVIVKSKTGSGKTASFAIPIIEEIEWNERAPQAIVLTPTRELAMQIKQDFDHIGAYKRMKTLAIYGKSPFRFQAQDLKERTHIVAGTPGRILDHLKQDTLNVSKLRYVILDEADEMLNMGFIDDVEEILEYFPGNITICMFSATMPSAIQELASGFMKEPKIITCEQSDQVNDHVEHYAYHMKEHEKTDFLLKLLCAEKPESCIIFAKTQEHVIDVCDTLYEKGISVDKLHGGMLQEDRIQNMKDFKLGNIRILVATDVASRGIDIANVTHIINYDMPEKKETYIHRIGRTGRVDARGVAISFIAQYDEERVRDLEEYLGYALTMKDKEAIEAIKVTSAMLKTLDTPEVQKEEKGKDLRKDTMKLYLNGGKAKKVRAGDIVGAICEIPGVCGDDIGIIQVQESQSYVDILHGKGNLVLKALQKKTIKGKNLKVQKAREEN